MGKIQNAMQTCFMEARIPPAIAKGILNHIEQQAAKTATMDDAQYADAAASMEQDLRREWGANYDRNLKMAEAVLARITTNHKFFSQVLVDSGANIDPWLVRTLYNLAVYQGVTS